jgi:hypothetical protein
VRRGPARTLAAGAAVALAYAISAMISGQLSPLARRPVLDGLPPPIPYRWVEPPPELAPTNEPPETETFRVPLGPDGSPSNVITMSDAQVSLILPEGAFAAAEDQRAVEVTIEPLASSAVGPADEPNRIVGNVYLLEASYLPSREPARLSADGEARVVLIYPLTTGDHGAHGVLVSRNGERWNAVDSTDFTGIQQTDGPIDGLGYVAVASSPAPATSSPTATPSVDTGGSSTATIVIVACLVILMGALGWLFLAPSRRRTGSARGSRPGTRSRSR